MHRPPAVSFQVGRSRWHAAALLGSGLLALLTLPMMALNTRPEFPVGALWGQTVLVVLCCAAAAMAWHRSPAGSLRWDGDQWHWVANQDSTVSGLHVVFDFQRCMLVSLRLADHRRLYVWLDRSPVHPQAWLALRRALVHAMQHGLLAPSTAMNPEGEHP